MRGTAVTRLAEAECSAAEIASITGHSMRDVGAILDVYLARTGKIALGRHRQAGKGKSMTMEILTPKSRRWDEFADALFAVTRVPGNPDEWLCDGDAGEHVYRYAKAVMTKMGNIDIAGTLAFFREHGGYCDCEILFNVDVRPEATCYH